MSLNGWVPSFSGDTSLSLDLYLCKVREFCVFHDLDESKQVLLAKNRCTGSAEAVLRGKSFASIPELRSCLEASLDSTEEEAFAALTSIRQGFHEPVTAFADRLRLASQGTVVKEAPFLLRRLFLQGLLPTLQQQVARLAPDTFELALAKAKIFEADQRSDHHLRAYAGSPAFTGRMQAQGARVPGRAPRPLPERTVQPVVPEVAHLDFDDIAVQIQHIQHAFQAIQGSPRSESYPTAHLHLYEHVDCSPVTNLRQTASRLSCLLNQSVHQPSLSAESALQLERCQSALCDLQACISESSQQSDLQPAFSQSEPAASISESLPLEQYDSDPRQPSCVATRVCEHPSQEPFPDEPAAIFTAASAAFDDFPAACMTESSTPSDASCLAMEPVLLNLPADDHLSPLLALGHASDVETHAEELHHIPSGDEVMLHEDGSGCVELYYVSMEHSDASTAQQHEECLPAESAVVLR